ncbi:MAG: hypothetical protein J6U43_03075 [Bacteroidales bacterium]|nr:hypothetical protein [Bacteroidales bacterium]
MGKFISFMLGLVAGALILFAIYSRDKGDVIVEQEVTEDAMELSNDELLEEYRLMLDEYRDVIQEQERLLKKYNTPTKTTKQAATKPSVVKEEAPATKPVATKRDPRYHYFEVLKGKEYITLHTSMHKDTVEMLFGKPHEVDVYEYTYSNEFHERWTYKYGNSNTSSHEFHFINGRLKDVTSY